jgi:hypothetical protein
MAANERVERGEDKREAERAARREFGNVGLVKETTRDVLSKGPQNVMRTLHHQRP